MDERWNVVPSPDPMGKRAKARLWLTILGCLTVGVVRSCAQSLRVEVVPLPALLVNGQPARAHTQGLEVHGGHFYVTARRDDVRPRRALLLRTEAAGTNWDVWDITPATPADPKMALDHPGGMQSDGKRLWIPIAESKPKSHSRICAFSLSSMVASLPLQPEFIFPVNDHIGAVAVAPDRDQLLGANWDTESVYIWDLQGHLKRTLTGSALGMRSLGLVAGPNGGSGVAVQDWKAIGDRLFASGLGRALGAEAMASRSRWLSFTNFLEAEFHVWAVRLPLQGMMELGREAMAVAGDRVYFLPEDLGASNRLFRVLLVDLLKPSTAQ